MIRLLLDLLAVSFHHIGSSNINSYLNRSGKGTNLEGSTCPKFATGSYDPCYAAFMGLHITPSATGYFEVGFSLSCCPESLFNVVSSL